MRILMINTMIYVDETGLRELTQRKIYEVCDEWGKALCLNEVAAELICHTRHKEVRR